MLEFSKILKLIVAATTVSLTACQAETPPSSQAQPTEKIIAQETAPQIQAVKPTYGFERQLKNCVDTVCKSGDIKKMSMSDYNPALISKIGLTKMDTL